MKLLLDENLPKRLKLDFSEYEIYTVAEQNWRGIKNGELLKLLRKNNFTALLTFDKNLQYQQNFITYPITVFVLSARINSYEELSKLTPRLKEYFRKASFSPGVVIIKPD
ncbi:MAG: DUF5615 family PIN-like protein [Ferruginibacter sp.]